MTDMNDQAECPPDGAKLNEWQTMRMKKAMDAVQQAWGGLWKWHTTPGDYQDAMIAYHTAWSGLQKLAMDVGTFPRRDEDKPCLRCGANPQYINLTCTSCCPVGEP